MPGFAREQHNLAFAHFRLRPAADEQFEFFFPTDKFCQAACVGSHSASFESCDEDAPSKSGTKHLARLLLTLTKKMLFQNSTLIAAVRRQ
jgi:hypothetical protein